MMARARAVALPLAVLAVVSNGSGLAPCESEGGECQAEGSTSLSMLQRGSEARGRKRQQAVQPEESVWRPDWHNCDQPPTDPKTLSNETLGNLEHLNQALEHYDLFECFVTYIGEEADYYDRVANQSWVNTICEVGFNAGHSATLLLSANQHAKLYSFDLGVKNYSFTAMSWVNNTFPGRFSITVGNSVETIPRFAEERPDVKCDLIIVDGGHEFEVAQADIANFQRLANPDRHLVIVDDTPCTREICMGPDFAWHQAVYEGVINVLDRAGNEVQGWSLGNYTSVGKSWLEK